MRAAYVPGMGATEEPYVVEVGFPASPQFCEEARARYLALLGRVTDNPTTQPALAAMPAITVVEASITAAVLQLRWVDCSGEHAWEAIQAAFGLLGTIAPGLVALPTVMMRAYPQELDQALDRRAQQPGPLPGDIA